jgi:hypothetical protein
MTYGGVARAWTRVDLRMSMLATCPAVTRRRREVCYAIGVLLVVGRVVRSRHDKSSLVGMTTRLAA